MEHFHPHQSGSKLPHSKERSVVQFYSWLRPCCSGNFVRAKKT